MKPTTLYILRTEKPKIYKIGITTKTALHRAKQIRASSRLLVLPILEKRLLCANALELALHRALRRFQRVQTGSGKTEYFRLVAPIFWAVYFAVQTIWLIEKLFIALLVLAAIILFIFVVLVLISSFTLGSV